MKINSFKCKAVQISTNKVIEFQLSRWAESDCFGFSWWGRKKQDHPGLEVCLTLFYHEFRVDFYDWRHWDVIKTDKKTSINS